MVSAVIGVDFGTESCRAGVFDAETGQALGFCSEPYATAFPSPGRAEQDPHEWWAALAAAVRGAVAAASTSSSSSSSSPRFAGPADVRALCVDTTCCTVVAFDRSHPECAPLRPAILWMDMRAAEQADRVLATGDAAVAVNGGGQGPVSAEWFIPKALWLKENEPGVWTAPHCGLCEFQDWVNLRLTGEYAASRNNVGVRWHFGDGAAPLGLLAKLGLDDLRDRWPAEGGGGGGKGGGVLALGERVGQGLTAAAAEHLGLPVGTIVAQGGADAFIGMLGLGVTKAGEMAMLTGSSHLHLGLSDKPLHAPGMFGSYADALLPGLHVVEGGQTSTGSALAWLRGRVLNASAAAAAHAAEAAAEGEGEQQGSKGATAAAGAGLSYAQLDAQAALLPPGSDGVLALDHFQGNRTPHTDARSRGALVGLTLAHSAAHLHRALLEGVCFGTEAVLGAMRAAGFRPRSLRVAGGATRSPLWLQMHADVSGLPLTVPAGAADAPALGCAVLAAAAAGFHGGDIARAAEAMVRVDRVLQPDPERTAAYAPVYRRWAGLYPALRPTFHALGGGGEGGGGGNNAAAAAPSLSLSLDALPLVAAARRARVAVAPSLLAADLADLTGDLARLEKGWPTDGSGADDDHDAAAADAADASPAPNPNPNPADPLSRRWLHFDAFDGSLGSQITFGAPLMERLRPRTRRLVDVHLIARDPGRHLAALRAAGADTVTLQFENVVDASTEAEARDGGLARLGALVDEARALFGSAGVALALGTPASALPPGLLAKLDRVLVMAVPLGYGGQPFQPGETLPKIRALRAAAGPGLVIGVDGGVGPAEAALCAEAGANVLVAGSSVFRAKGGRSPADAERDVLRAATEGAARRVEQQHEEAATVAAA